MMIVPAEQDMPHSLIQISKNNTSLITRAGLVINLYQIQTKDKLEPISIKIDDINSNLLFTCSTVLITVFTLPRVTAMNIPAILHSDNKDNDKVNSGDT